MTRLGKKDGKERTDPSSFITSPKLLRRGLKSETSSIQKLPKKSKIMHISFDHKILIEHSNA